MSHSITSDGWNAHFNSDLSGNVEFIRHAPDMQTPATSIQVPCSLIKAIIANYVRGNVVALIENATDDEILISGGMMREDD